MIEPPLKPTVVLPDTTPLILLAAGDALHVLTDLGRVVIVDVVELEATFHRAKPYADQIAGWIAAGRAAGSNAALEVANSELGPLYRMALEQGLKTPRHLGELAMAEWLVEKLALIGGPALVVYEDLKVPAMMIRQGLTEEVALSTTRNILTVAEENGYIADAAAVWSRIKTAIPSANPSSVFTWSDRHHTMTEPVHPAILRYMRLEISALRAAGEMGNDVSISEVIQAVIAAGLEIPQQEPEQAARELARARRVLRICN